MSEIKICENNRFSKFVPADDTEQMQILVGWVKWFADKGIKSCLSQVSIASVPHYAVYRNGMNNFDDRVRCQTCQTLTGTKRHIGNNEYLCADCAEDVLIFIGVNKK